MKGDKKFLAKLFDDNLDGVYRFFYNKFQQREIAEDLTGETFLSFAEMFRDGVDYDNPQRYLYGIARNKYFNYLKEKKELPITYFESGTLEIIAEKVSEINNTDDNLELPTQEEEITLVLDKLPRKQSQIVRLRFLEKLNLQEIAELLGKNMNYVKTTQRRALKSLKKAINKNRSK